MFTAAALVFLVPPATVFAAPDYPPSETVTYRDLDGNVLTLRAFSGRFIRYALPASWLDAGGQSGLSPAEVTALVAETDELYLVMKQTIGGEPRGDGLMTLAIVPLTSGEVNVGGTAILGVKTCEIASSQLSGIKQALSRGVIADVILHEVAHTFDIYRNYLSYYSDSSHSWTAFWMIYAPYLMRSGNYGAMPEVMLQSKVYDLTSKWDSLASSSTWERCVKSGGGCEGEGVTANRAIAGLLMRYARLHGVEAVRRVFEFFKDYKATHDSNEIFNFTAEQKNDLLTEALSYGISFDASREADIWFWPVSTDEREKLRQQYTTVNPNLLDRDGDGWSPARGDFNDNNRSVNPGAIEVINGRDDDCNGIIDDVQRTAGPTLFSPPSRLTGHSRSGLSDVYHFEGAGTLLIKTRVLTGSFTAQVSIIREGQVTASNLFAVEPYKSNCQEFSLATSGPWVLKVDWLSGGEGDYEVVLAFTSAVGTEFRGVYALPLRAPNSTGSRAIVPGELARVVAVLSGAGITNTVAAPDQSGAWPTTVSGTEIRVNGIACEIVNIRRAQEFGPEGEVYSADFIVPGGIVAGARASVQISHLASGTTWRSEDVPVLSSSGALWSGAQNMSVAALDAQTSIAFTEGRGAPANTDVRVALFASGLGKLKSTGVRLIAELPDGRRISIAVEYVGATNLPGIDQIVFRPDGALAGADQILLSIEGGDNVWLTLPLK